MSNKRILIFGYSSSSHIHKWVHSLSERGYEIRVISLGGRPIENIDCIIIPRKGKLSYFSSYKSAVKHAIAFQPDIIHSHYAGGYGFWGMKTNCHPFILSVWGSDINELPKTFFNRYLIKKILKKADFVTGTSKALLNNTISLENAVSSKSQVIPFGVNIPAETNQIEPYNNSAIFIKHLEPVYAPDILIKAAIIVIEKFPDFKLTIAGKGSLYTELQRTIETMELTDNITLTGHINHQDIYKYISKHQFMVMPSQQEGFGVAAVESFACSRPVVATNVGGIPEIVTDNQNGYLVAPNNVEAIADAMIRMLSDKDKMIQMGQNGYNVAKEKFDWEKSVDLMVQLYVSF